MICCDDILWWYVMMIDCDDMICCDDMLWWYVLMICYDAMLWWYVMICYDMLRWYDMMICYDDMLWWYVVMICCDDMFWYVLMICSDDMFWCYVMMLCYDDMLRCWYLSMMIWYATMLWYDTSHPTLGRGASDCNSVTTSWPPNTSSPVYHPKHNSQGIRVAKLSHRFYALVLINIPCQNNNVRKQWSMPTDSYTLEEHYQKRYQERYQQRYQRRYRKRSLGPKTAIPTGTTIILPWDE